MRAWIPVAIAAAVALVAQAPALAQADPTAGPIVTEVRFEGDVLQEDRLRELLTVQTGVPYDPRTVRTSMERFFEKGLFRAIAVEREPTPGGAAVIFRFTRQVIVTGWKVEGNRHLSEDQVLRAMDLRWGEPLNPQEFNHNAAMIQERYLREGYFQAKAALSVRYDKPGEATLLIRIDEGTPTVLSELRILSPGPFSEGQVRRLVGIQAGDRLRREALAQITQNLERQLAEEAYLNNRVSTYFLLPDGSRVSNFFALTSAKPTQVVLVVAIDPGVKGTVVVDADVLLPVKQLADAITVYQNRSYSPYELDACAENLRRLYVAEGFPNAKVTHTLKEQGNRSYLITFKIVAGAQVQIAEVRFEGNRQESSARLQSVLETRGETRWLRGSPFDPELWAEDLARLQNFYRSNGFLEAKVSEGPRSLNAAGDRLTLTARIQEGPQTRVAKILFTGVAPFHEAGILQSLPLNPGEPYNPNRLNEWVASVQAYYAKSGYPLAQVEARLEPGPTPEASALRFEVKPGPRKKIGAVIFRGNVKTHDIVIRRELTVQPGQWYNSEELLKTQQQIYQLGFFDRVNIVPMRPITPNSNEAVDMIVELQERETGWVGIGGGYGDRQDSKGLQASVEYTQNNLGGSGRPLRLETIVSQQFTQGRFSLRDPYFLGQKLIGEVGTTATLDQSRVGLNSFTYGPTFGLSKQLTDSLLGSVRYTWSRVHYLAGTSEDYLVRTGGLWTYTDSLFTTGLTYDTRSDLINPRWGTKTDANLDLATPVLGGNLIYTRPRVTVAHFIPVTRRIVLALGAEAGYIQSLAGNEVLPADVLFTVGGGNSLRGYEPRTGVRGTNEPGRGMFLGHAELRFPVWNDVYGVVFTDAGNIWAKPSDINPLDSLVTMGPGVRYLTPVGPLRLDVAFRVYPFFELAPMPITFGIGQAF